MLVLAIETSCDETAVAVVRDGREILANLIVSQIDIHARFGGVVPELASRQHLQAICPLVDAALAEAGTSLEQIEGIAVTRGPGLIGALLVGVAYAKAIAFARQIPLVGVHHIEGHILAVQLEKLVEFPYLALAVSGGHSHLFRVEGIGQYQLLGRTIDDAAGEAFDKVAKMLGLPYPGGPVIDRLAKVGDASCVRFPRPMLKKPNLDFSFSGMKTAVLTYIESLNTQISEQQTADIAAAFQEAAVDVLVQKTMRAARQEGLSRIVVAGGVACNSGLRSEFSAACRKECIDVYFPSPLLCSDNAAMLAVAGDAYLERGYRSASDLNAVSNWPLPEAALHFI
ncbi:tRNA (adenosine(37)-N6)-threonylcarbamoyltransferase complex transferase subunit TsaD [Geopsychrobacter electrodiphilus]|uniref:tRNA (adenosine(37)-N6)-threonylcarbamoyltransferase complex transferase subunit TsaD n=1 Tax=Geopsychrobacter electrodiphilus TaxID=225196 RepID=UPI00036CAD13|nr:tRNA (adenosine(37)-N6)-threonylcarbamoyltransferase complex transferase subunit TsaD [Geopsychrobacter electrodiphilus]